MATYSAPTVQNLGDIVKELQPSVQEQTDVIGKQKAANAAIYDAQRSALDAAKVQGFNDINSQATGRGMTFSGIPLNEQAEYLSTKYLPGVQQANAQQNADALAYDKSIADLNTNVFNKAFDTRTGQINNLNDWNKMMEGQEFTTSEREASQKYSTSEREASQKFTTSEREASQNFTASQNAADRAASAANAARASASPSISPKAAVQSYLENNIDPSTGTVSVKAWQRAAQMAYDSGIKFGGDNGFASTFWGYANDSDWQDYKLGYDKYL